MENLLRGSAQRWPKFHMTAQHNHSKAANKPFPLSGRRSNIVLAGCHKTEFAMVQGQ
jgi:hypothetical protein